TARSSHSSRAAHRHRPVSLQDAMTSPIRPRKQRRPSNRPVSNRDSKQVRRQRRSPRKNGMTVHKYLSQLGTPALKPSLLASSPVSNQRHPASRTQMKEKARMPSQHSPKRIFLASIAEYAAF